MFAIVVVVALAVVGHAAQIETIEPTLAGSCPVQMLNPILRPYRTMCPPPKTDVKRLRLWRSAPPVYPWTHPVRCVKTTGNSSSPRAGLQFNYCLYTDATFGGAGRGGGGPVHGVSMLTTPETAADLAGIDAFEARPFYGGSRQRVLVPGPVDGVQSEGARSGKPAYTIQPSRTPSLGLGVVAQRKLKQGEIFMLDLPALLISKDFLEDAKPAKVRRRLIRRGLAQLPEATRARVLALSKSTGGGDEVDAILGTNTINVNLGQDRLHLGLFPELSRINHACSPNAYYRFSPRTLAVEVVAYRDIQPGEEVTISYTQLTQSRTERRLFLQNNWHFNCSCALCRADADTMTRSEDRRRDIRKLQQEIGQTTRNGDHLMALRATDELERTTAEEGVATLAAELDDIRASIHLDKQDWARARAYGRFALTAWEQFDSVDEVQLQAARWFMAFVEMAQLADAEARAKQAREDEELRQQMEDEF